MSNKMIQIRRDGFQNKLELKTNYEETDNLIDTFNDMMYQIEESFNQQRQFVEDASRVTHAATNHSRSFKFNSTLG